MVRRKVRVWREGEWWKGISREVYVRKIYGREGNGSYVMVDSSANVT